MRTRFLVISSLFCLVQATAQTHDPNSPLYGNQYGVVLEHPDMKKVIVKKNVLYLQDAKGSLHVDMYFPVDMKKQEKIPAVIFLNAIGDSRVPGDPKVKEWGIYRTWPQLMAANGYVGISMEADDSRVMESIEGLFQFLKEKGEAYNIDADRLGVYAASANVSRSATYLMSKKVSPGIKAAVLYYGAVPEGPYRKDLPVLFLISEGDVQRGGYKELWEQVLKNNAPWTITMGSGLPHAFDAFYDDDASRKAIRETISFWKNNLDPVPKPSFASSKGRNVIGLLQMNRPKAMELLKELAVEYPNDIQTLAVYGELLGADHKYPEAESMYQRILDKKPENIPAILSLAALSYAQNKTEQGDKYVAKVAGMKSLVPQNYIDLGFTMLVAGKDKQAAEFYEKGIAMNPHPRGVDYYNLACAYAKANISDKALSALDKAIINGYSSKQQFVNDPDLNSLKDDERFKTLLTRLN